MFVRRVNWIVIGIIRNGVARIRFLRSNKNIFFVNSQIDHSTVTFKIIHVSGQIFLRETFPKFVWEILMKTRRLINIDEWMNALNT